MQLYALDSQGKITHAQQALRQTDYHCLECGGTSRLRGGPHRQRHFFHVDPPLTCRQHQKGAIHLKLQSYLQQLLPAGDCRLEMPFPSISRIADVAWISKKIIFEIQCSPISGDEIAARNSDYSKEGWTVIWILHDQRYNRKRLSTAEDILYTSPHFFTNMDAEGTGFIYDQMDIRKDGIRVKRLPPLPIRITDFTPTALLDSLKLPFPSLEVRKNNWPLSFKGDLLSTFINQPDDPYWNLAQSALKEYLLPQTSFFHHFVYIVLNKGIVIPYRILFRFILEKMCR